MFTFMVIFTYNSMRAICMMCKMLISSEANNTKDFLLFESTKQLATRTVARHFEVQETRNQYKTNFDYIFDNNLSTGALKMVMFR